MLDSCLLPVLGEIRIWALEDPDQISPISKCRIGSIHFLSIRTSNTKILLNLPNNRRPKSVCGLCSKQTNSGMDFLFRLFQRKLGCQDD